jgi:hypothetical protein
MRDTISFCATCMSPRAASTYSYFIQLVVGKYEMDIDSLGICVIGFEALLEKQSRFSMWLER